MTEFNQQQLWEEKPDPLTSKLNEVAPDAKTEEQQFLNDVKRLNHLLRTKAGRHPFNRAFIMRELQGVELVPDALEWRTQVQPYTNLSSTFRISYYIDKKTDGKGYTDVLFINDIRPEELHTKINEVLTLTGVWSLSIYAETRNNPNGGN